MKIGIITFHCAHNYGAVIQCYGLQQHLQSNGHQVYVIDYRPKYFDLYKIPKIRKSNYKNKLNFLKDWCREAIVGNSRKKRYYAFEDFITKRLNLISYTPTNDFSDFDAIIIGSDQIWNPDITGGSFDEIFFGTNARCKVISYAASSRFVSLNKEQEYFFKCHLNKISSISVRETSLQTLLQPLSNKIISTVIDPSLLPDVLEYKRLCTNIQRKRPYVLVYEVERNTDTSRIANEIATKLNADVVELVSSISPRFIGSRFKQEIGPQDFLSFINQAICVVTSSFHGMALSIKFQKDFYSVKQGTNADLRTESLLSKLGLLERFVDMKSSITFSKIDYRECNKKLLKEIQSSKNFLSDALSK